MELVLADFQGFEQKTFEYYRIDTHFVHCQTVRNIFCMNKKSFTGFLVRIIEAQFEKKIKDFEAEISRKNKNILG